MYVYIYTDAQRTKIVERYSITVEFNRVRKKYILSTNLISGNDRLVQKNNKVFEIFINLTLQSKKKKKKEKKLKCKEKGKM